MGPGLLLFTQDIISDKKKFHAIIFVSGFIYKKLKEVCIQKRSVSNVDPDKTGPSRLYLHC